MGKIINKIVKIYRDIKWGFKINRSEVTNKGLYFHQYVQDLIHCCAIYNEHYEDVLNGMMAKTNVSREQLLVELDSIFSQIQIKNTPKN